LFHDMLQRGSNRRELMPEDPSSFFNYQRDG
jgi:hypothetical protein